MVPVGFGRRPENWSHVSGPIQIWRRKLMRFRIKYSPGAVSSWLSVSDPASLWRRNLELKSGDDT